MSVVLTGNFDGLHIGHAALVRTAAETAEQRGEPLYVYTFSNNPKNCLDSGAAVPDIMPKTDRDALLKTMGADKVISVTFDRKFADMTADEYLDMLSSDYGCSCIVCGENFCFGRGGQCRVSNIGEYAAAHGMDFRVVPLERLASGETVSSTAVRACIRSGDMSAAENMLGRYFYIRGCVVHGRRNGSVFGFPTMNIVPDVSVVIPRRGVYETVTGLDGKLWRSMTNIGTAPTVSQDGAVVAETNLIYDFSGAEPGPLDAYGRIATVSFVRFIRPEIRFEGVSDLVAQLGRDRQSVMESDAANYDKVVRF